MATSAVPASSESTERSGPGFWRRHVLEDAKRVCMSRPLPKKATQPWHRRTVLEARAGECDRNAQSLIFLIRALESEKQADDTHG